MSKRGQINKLLAPVETANDEVLNQWRDVLARYEVVLPTNPKLQKWRCLEEDPTGEYVAAYSRTGSRTSAALTKRNAGYQSPAGGSTNRNGLLARVSVDGSGL